MVYVGDKIKEMRLRRGLTQEELAERMNVSKQTISNYEQDRRVPDLHILSQLSQVLHVSIIELMDKEERDRQFALLGSSPDAPTFSSGISADMVEAIINRALDSRAVSIPALSHDEQALLSAYRALTAEGRSLLCNFADMLRAQYSTKEKEA